LNMEIDALFSRVTKIHEKEFEVLPKAWKKLQMAVGDVSLLIHPGRQYPELESATSERLEEILKASNLSKIDKKELRALPNRERLRYYSERQRWYELWDVEKSTNEFHRYIKINSIFISSDLRKKFLEADDLLFKAVVEKKINRNSKGAIPMDEAAKELKGKIGPITNEIEKMVQDQFEFEKANVGSTSNQSMQTDQPSAGR